VNDNPEQYAIKVPTFKAKTGSVLIFYLICIGATSMTYKLTNELFKPQTNPQINLPAIKIMNSSVQL